MRHNTNIATILNKSYHPEVAIDSDTTKIAIADSEILIIDNDTTVNVSIADHSNIASEEEAIPEEYKDVNVEVIEGANSTHIIVHKDGDTIKNYEMNYDFQAEGDLNDLEFDKDENEKHEAKGNKSFSFTKKNKSRFRGHWAGLEFGLNNYLTDDFSMTPEDNYMEINTSKSWNFNLNFAQFSVPLVRDRFGLVSGLGIEWNNYHFSNKNTIIKDQTNYIIRTEDLSSFALKKNRLQTTYLTAPLLMEVQLGSSTSHEKRVAISTGVIAGLKLGAQTKYKTGDGKVKNKDDFYLQSFRYGFTARINYDNVGFYFNYYNVPLFINGKGPELYPFAAGLVLSFD